MPGVAVDDGPKLSPAAEQLDVGRGFVGGPVRPGQDLLGVGLCDVLAVGDRLDEPAVIDPGLGLLGPPPSNRSRMLIVSRPHFRDRGLLAEPSLDLLGAEPDPDAGQLDVRQAGRRRSLRTAAGIVRKARAKSASSGAAADSWAA